MAPNAQSQLPHLQIVDKLVSEFPLVNSALDYANSRYAALKGSSTLVSSTLDRAEKSIQLVVNTGVVPVLNKLEQPIHYADNIAVQSLDIAVAKIGSIQKSSGELKDSTRKVVDQTKERLQAAKSSALQTVHSKVQSVLTLPSNVVPLLDQILNAGENVLDYLMPESNTKAGASKPATNGTSGKHEDGASAAQDTKTVIRLVIFRVRQFSDKVQKRIVDYSRERWIPAFFGSVVVIQKNVTSLVASSVAAKLLANGHSSPAATPSQSDTPKASSNASTPQKNATASTASTPSSNSTTTSSGSPAQNGDLSKSSAQSSSENQEAEEYDSVTSS